jgi:hypothetical protein
MTTLYKAKCLSWQDYSDWDNIREKANISIDIVVHWRVVALIENIRLSCKILPNIVYSSLIYPNVSDKDKNVS